MSATASPLSASTPATRSNQRPRVPLRRGRSGFPRRTRTETTSARSNDLSVARHRFVGPTSVCVSTQKVGVINDHIHGRFGGTDHGATAGSRRRRGAFMEQSGRKRRQPLANRPASRTPETSPNHCHGCDRLPRSKHGKEGVDGPSPSEGFHKGPAIGPWMGGTPYTASQERAPPASSSRSWVREPDETGPRDAVRVRASLHPRNGSPVVRPRDWRRRRYASRQC